MEGGSNPFGEDDGGENPFVAPDKDGYGVVNEFSGTGVIREGSHSRGDATYAPPGGGGGAIYVGGSAEGATPSPADTGTGYMSVAVTGTEDCLAESGGGEGVEQDDGIYDNEEDSDSEEEGEGIYGVVKGFTGVGVVRDGSHAVLGEDEIPATPLEAFRVRTRTLHQDKMTRPKSSNGAGNRTTTLELYSAFAPTMIERLIEIITAADKAGTQLPDLRGELVKEFGSLAFEYNKPAILSALAQRSASTAPTAQEEVLADQATTPPDLAVESTKRGSPAGDDDSDDELPPLPPGTDAEGDAATFSGGAGSAADLSAAVTAAATAAAASDSAGGGGEGEAEGATEDPVVRRRRKVPPLPNKAVADLKRLSLSASDAIGSALKRLTLDLEESDVDWESMESNADALAQVRSQQNITAVITGFSRADGGSRRKTFSITVNSGGKGGQEWQVDRFYSDFRRLRDQMKTSTSLKLRGGTSKRIYSDFPAKHGVGAALRMRLSTKSSADKQDAGFMEQRMVRLNKWLKVVVETVDVQRMCDHVCLDEFFEVFWHLRSFETLRLCNT